MNKISKKELKKKEKEKSKKKGKKRGYNVVNFCCYYVIVLYLYRNFSSNDKWV